MIHYKCFLFAFTLFGYSSFSLCATLEPLDETDRYIVSTCERADFFLGIQGLQKPSNIEVEVRDIAGELIGKQSVASVSVAGGNSFIHVKHAVDTCQQHGWFNIRGYVVGNDGKRSPLHSKVSFVVLPELSEDAGFWGVAGLWGLTASTSRFTDSDAMRLKKIGAHGVRFFIDWRSMSNADDWAVLWRQVDGMYTTASHYNLEVLPVLVVAPEYAVASNQDNGLLRARLPEGKAWYEFIEKIGQRYKGKITQWEIWNEPNVKGFWNGDIAAYARKLNVAFTVLKNIDKHNTVVTGGTSGIDVNWVKSLVQITDKFDVLAIHTYRKAEPEKWILGMGHYGGHTLIDDLDVLKKVLPSDKKIWITEVGVNTLKRVNKRLFLPVSEKQQASRLVRQSIIAKSMGVEKAYWWMLRDGFGLGTGLLSRDWNRLNVKPALTALAWVNYLVSQESKVTKFDNNENLFQYKIETKGKVWEVVWSMQDMLIPALCNKQYYGMMGQEYTSIKSEGRCALHLEKELPIFWREQ